MIAHFLALGLFTITSYRPIPAQTKPECQDVDHCRTSIGDVPTKFGIAVSQDLLKSGAVHYGDILYVEGYGFRVVNDCMNIRHKKAADLLVFTYNEEKQVGVRHLRVWKIEHDKNFLPAIF